MSSTIPRAAFYFSERSFSMKKGFIFGLIIMLFSVCSSWADGTVTQSDTILVGKNTILVVFTCVGDDSDGSIPDTDLSTANTYKLKMGNYSLRDVIAFPTPSGTAPDAADVTVKIKSYPTRTSGGVDSTISPAVPRDILGGAGTNLIHATDEQNIGPTMPLYEPVVGPLTLGVANQGTLSAEFTIIFKFKR
jgi:hypothetical protein